MHSTSLESKTLEPMDSDPLQLDVELIAANLSSLKLTAANSGVQEAHCIKYSATSGVSLGLFRTSALNSKRKELVSWNSRHIPYDLVEQPPGGGP